MAKKNSKAQSGTFEVPELENSCKTLLANINFADIDGDDLRVICVTSSVPNEGKTTIATNLALAFAKAGKTTLIIEGDLRRKSIARRLDLHLKGGLFAIISGRAKVSQVVVRTRYPNLYFLDAEPGMPNPAALLGSKRFASLVRHLRKSFDYVVIDTPPTNAFPDAPIVSALADGTVLVVRRRFTKVRDVENAIAQLRQADANLLGTVFTFCEGRESDYYYYSDYYEKDGMSLAHGDSADAATDAGAQTDVQDFDENLTEWEQAMGIEPDRPQPERPHLERSQPDRPQPEKRRATHAAHRR